VCSDCAGAELDDSGECKEGCRAGAALESRHSLPSSSTSKVADTTGKAERRLHVNRVRRHVVIAMHAKKNIHMYRVPRIVPAREDDRSPHG
jgi:hypothetical protein